MNLKFKKGDLLSYDKKITRSKPQLYEVIDVDIERKEYVLRYVFFFNKNKIINTFNEPFKHVDTILICCNYLKSDLYKVLVGDKWNI